MIQVWLRKSRNSRIMKPFLILFFLCITISIAFSQTTQPPEAIHGKLLVKEFNIDTGNPNLAQLAMEEEQLRLRNLFPDLNLVGVIRPNSPWVLITEKCQTEKELLKLKKQLAKECPDARITECD